MVDVAAIRATDWSVGLLIYSPAGRSQAASGDDSMPTLLAQAAGDAVVNSTQRPYWCSWGSKGDPN